MKNALGGLALISVGVLHILALRKEWGWFMNHFQVRGMIDSWGESGFKFYTYLICGLCVGFGFLLLLGKI